MFRGRRVYGGGEQFPAAQGWNSGGSDADHFRQSLLMFPGCCSKCGWKVPDVTWLSSP